MIILKNGLKLWKVALILVIYISISIIISKFGIRLISKEQVKLDTGLAIMFCTLLALMILDVKESGKKVIKFVQKHYLKVIIGLIFCLSTTNLMHNAIYSMRIIREEASTVEQDEYALVVNVYNRIIGNLKNYDKGLHRMVTRLQKTANDSLIYGYNGVSYSGSTYSKELYSFLEKLGIRRSHVRISCDLENTKTVDMLLGIKYLVENPHQELPKEYPIIYEELFIESNEKIYKNPYSLSLGYVVNKDIFNTYMNNINTFELQNEILKNMTNIQKNVYMKHEGEISERLDGVEKDELKYIPNDENSKIIYEFEAESNDNIYMYILAKNDYGMEINVDGTQKIRHTGFANNEMVNIGRKEIGEKVKVEIEPDGAININQIYIYYENEEILKQHYNRLQSKQVQMEKIDNRRYKGNINIQEESEYVMFTIPYEKGWNIKVDGQKVEYEKALDALTVINLNKGEHEILLEYMPLGIYIGIMTSIVGIMMFGIIIIWMRKN